MQIFCVIPRTHASNYGFMMGSYLPLVERFFLDGLILAHRRRIVCLLLAYPYLVYVFFVEGGRCLISSETTRLPL